MKPYLIDTHAHMYADEFKDDRAECMERALNEGVGLTILPNIDGTSIPEMAAMQVRWPEQIRAMMGLHPCYVKADYRDQLRQIETVLRNGDFVAIGEIGIDLYWDKTTLDWQIDAFVQQLQWAEQLDLPICVHARESLPEIFDTLESHTFPGLKGVFHCFTGNMADVERASKIGNFYFGLGGVITFKNGGMADVASQLPIDRILLETDAPYLSPVPFRGKRNETAYTLKVAQELAKIRSAELDDIAEQTTKNALKLFNLQNVK